MIFKENEKPEILGCGKNAVPSADGFVKGKSLRYFCAILPNENDKICHIHNVEGRDSE